MRLKRQGYYQGRLAGLLPSGLRGDIYLGGFIMVQAHKLGLIVLRESLYAGEQIILTQLLSCYQNRCVNMR